MTPVVVMINPETEHGGIETLILRKARWYRAHGYRPVVLAVFRGSLHQELIAAGAEVWYGYVPLGRNLNEGAPQIRAFAAQAQRKLGHAAGAVQFVEAFGPSAAAIGERLAAQLGVPCVAGAFHPEAYYVSGFDGTALLRNFTRRRALYFMNSAVRDAHALRAQADLPQTCFPLMLEADKPHLYHARSGGMALFSLGRLVPFKTYNLYMLDLVAALRESYPDLSYTVIGSGALSGVVRSRIAELGLEKSVNLIPEWPYSRLSELVERYDLHIGMGTTVIDLALYGMPSLVAVVDDQQARSPGFVHQDVNNTGETYGHQPQAVADLLAQFAALTADERSTISHAGVAAVRGQYDADELMPRFVEFARAAVVPDSRSEFRSVATTKANHSDYVYWRFRRDFYGVWKRYSVWKSGKIAAARSRIPQEEATARADR